MARSKDLAKALEKAVAVSKRHTAALMRLPGIVAVGAGLKRRRGKLTDAAAIVVTVKKKLNRKELEERGWKPLPGEIESVPVDIIETGISFVSREIQARLEKAGLIKKRVASSWLKEKNVNGIGVGYKLTKGMRTDTVAIRIYVDKKLSPANLKRRGIKAVPAKIRGIPTDVIELKPSKAGFTHPSNDRGDRWDPLAGGLSTSCASEPYGYGTLSAIVFDNQNQAMGLSNEHVWDGDVGETVHQPSPIELDDSFDIDFQLDVCNPLNFLRIDTPNTTVGSILAGGAAGAALAAALSDRIDPTREGQEATIPAAGSFTQEEYTKAHIDHRHFPIPGTPFELNVKWRYERRTDAGTLPHESGARRKNRHTLLFHRLFTDQRTYGPPDTIELYGVIIPEPRHKIVDCGSYHCVAYLYPTSQDRTYPVVLRPVREHPDSDVLTQYFYRLISVMDDPKLQQLIKKHQQRLCLYYGEFSAAGVPLGSWDHFMHVQTVNTVPPGTDPLVAARTIGGLPVSQHLTSHVDIACGPFVFEGDGSFDIEPISI